MLTPGGTPVAVVVGLKNRDAEDAALEASPEFWRMIEDRRRRARCRRRRRQGE